MLQLFEAELPSLSILPLRFIQVVIYEHCVPFYCQVVFHGLDVLQFCSYILS